MEPLIIHSSLKSDLKFATYRLKKICKLYLKTKFD